MSSNNPSDVLASLLQPGDDNQDTPRGDAAEALLNYLHGTYQGHVEEQVSSSPHDEAHAARGSGRDHIPPFLPGSNTHEILSTRPSNIGRALSPPNPSIRIPSSVAELAAQHVPPVAVSLLDTDTVMDAAFAYNDYGGYGEMGGKRRKAPHERAGWKEMDMESGPRKRGRRSAHESAGGEAGASGYGAGAGAAGTGLPEGATGLEALGDLTKEQGEALARAFNEHEAKATEGEDGAAAPADAEDDGKGGRAEQNRRAQQVYRRKREERMKQLESAAAALEPLRKAYLDLVETTKELVMSHEAKWIENAALRAALLASAKSGNAYILTADGSFITPTTPRPATAARPAAVESAFVELEKQARELAKQHRREREGAQAQE